MKNKFNLPLFLLCFSFLFSCSVTESLPTLAPPTSEPKVTTFPTETNTSTPTRTPDPTATSTPTLEPTLTETPVPTNTPTSTLEPTPTQIVLSEPTVYEGSGDDVVILETGYNLILTKIEAPNNKGNFVVVPYTTNGEKSTSIVNHIGGYNTGWHITPDLSALEISSDSDWTVTVYEWSVQRMKIEDLVLFNGEAFSGTGDSVIVFAPRRGSEGFTDSLVELKVSNTSKGNFVVRWIVFGSGVDLLVNDIGDYEGSVLIKDTGGVIIVSSEGAWTLDTSLD